jgi:hypothetical protein
MHEALSSNPVSPKNKAKQNWRISAITQHSTKYRTLLCLWAKCPCAGHSWNIRPDDCTFPTILLSSFLFLILLVARRCQHKTLSLTVYWWKNSGTRHSFTCCIFWVSGIIGVYLVPGMLTALSYLMLSITLWSMHCYNYSSYKWTLWDPEMLSNLPVVI